jgi:hypothetical protein
MRTSGWRRLGIVLSVLWVFVGGFWGNNIGVHEGDFAKAMYDVCLHGDSDWAKCTADFEASYKRDIQYHWYYAAFLAFVPIPIAWLIVGAASASLAGLVVGFPRNKARSRRG